MLEPHFDAVEGRLNIALWPVELANANNQKLLDGAKKLGWQAAPTKRNVKACANSGYCGMGCPVDAKQAMHVTYLPDALADGLTLVVNCPVDRLERQGARMTGVKGRAHLPAAGRAAGQAVTVAAKTVNERRRHQQPWRFCCARVLTQKGVAGGPSAPRDRDPWTL